MHLAKVPTRSETRLVAVMRTIKVPADAEKDVAKAKGKSKKGSRSKSAGARDGDAVATETIIHQLKSKQRWCPHHLKGACPKGDSCALPHLDEDAVNRIKAAERRQMESAHDPGDAPERGRSPSREKRKGKWRKGGSGSE